MSQDTYPGYVWEITEAKIQKFDIPSFMVFREFLIENDIDESDASLKLADQQFIEDKEIFNEMKRRYDTFREDFNAKTGLDIWLSHIDDAEGDLKGSVTLWTVDASMIRPEAEAIGITWEDQKLFAVFG